jgi:Ca2+-binding EF-hand superfamily protein
MKQKVLITALVAGFAMSTAAVAGTDHDKDHKRGPHHGRIMEKLDTNKDGAISKEEFEAKRASEFSEADADKDGTVTMAELSAYHEQKREERRQARERRMFERLDENNDGTVSEDEFQKVGMFDRMDKNDDGKVTPDEMRWKGKHHGHGHHRDKDGDDKDTSATE